MVPSTHKGWCEPGLVIISSWLTSNAVLVWIRSVTALPVEASLRPQQEDPRCWLGSARGMILKSGAMVGWEQGQGGESSRACCQPGEGEDREAGRVSRVPFPGC